MSTFDMEKLQEALDKLKAIPPAPMLASSRWLPADRALSFTVDRRQYVGAHPSFWSRVPDVAERRECLNPLASLDVIDIDVDRRARARFFDALAQALDPPKPAPKPRGPIPTFTVFRGVLSNPGA